MKQNLPSRNKGAEQMEEQIRQALSRQAETVRGPLRIPRG